MKTSCCPYCCTFTISAWPLEMVATARQAVCLGVKGPLCKLPHYLTPNSYMECTTGSWGSCPGATDCH